MSAVLQPAPCRIAEFGKTTMLCLDTDSEITTLFRCHYTVDRNGYVDIHRIESDQSRPGKPQLWMDDHLSRDEMVTLLRDLEDSIRKEMRA